MLVNSSKNTILSECVIKNKSPLSKAMGLMFSKSPQTMIFIFNNEKKRSLHMFFVFFPIDVIYLNKEKKIVEVVEHFSPWSVYNPTKKSQYIIELAQGTIKKTKSMIGDSISWS